MRKVKHLIVIDALADLWARDLFKLIKQGKLKLAVSIGAKMGLPKKDVRAVIKEWK